MQFHDSSRQRSKLRSSIRLAIFALSFSALISSCAQKSTNPQDTSTGGSATTGTTSGTTPATQTAAQIEAANAAVFNKLSSCESLAEVINKYKLPDQTIMCTVGDSPVYVGDYKFILRQRQNRVRSILQMDPSKRMPLLEQSEKLKVQLTDEEKARLIRDGKAALGNNLQKFLQENKLTEQQFEGQILEMGRALKTASRELEMGLPNELINQSLLVDAGRKSGLAKVAFHRYIEFKHGPEFEQLASFADLSPNQLRDKLIEQFLADLMKEKINGTAEVRDSDILQLYKDNLDRFKNYIRFSQIVIAAPMQDLGAMESVRTQVMRQRPDLKGPALEEEIKNTEERQHQKALSVLAQIKNGANFADLCNTVTEDLPMRAAKQGGDMGYVSEDELKKNKLLAPVYQELQKLHPGEVCPEPVRTMFGWHIVKLTDRPRNGMVPFSAVKDDLKKAAVAQNSHLAVSTWIMEKRKTVPVTLGKEFEKALDEFEASKKK